jgi:hypothetical protein
LSPKFAIFSTSQDVATFDITQQSLSISNRALFLWRISVPLVDVLTEDEKGDKLSVASFGWTCNASNFVPQERLWELGIMGRREWPEI